MFRLKIFLILITNLFSFDRKNLRFFSLKRVIAVLLVLPFFTINLLINWFFLILDEILFPKFHTTGVDRALFIVGIPRSATTFLFHKILEDHSNFHGFKLWELIFAPSVCQKYICIGTRKLDKKIGSPLYKLLKFVDVTFFRDKKLREIHKTGLFVHEEDEALFLFNFSSVFFYFFTPQVKGLEKLVYHDEMLPEKIKNANFNFYRSCVKRHNYVFDRNNSKIFVSKNPTFTLKLNSLYDAFPSSKYLYPLRTPLETIPSTISLMAANYSRFCNMSEKYPMAIETRDMLIDYYIYADKLLKEKIKEKGLTILYEDVKKNHFSELIKIYQFLHLDTKDTKLQTSESKKSVTNKYKSKHRYDEKIGLDVDLIRRKLSEIMPAEIEL